MRVSAKFEFFCSAIWWLDALKKEKSIRENACEQKKKKPEWKFNPGLAPICLQTEFRDPSFDLPPVVQKVDKAIHQINL